MNMNIVAVDIKHGFFVYDYAKDNETKDELLKRAYYQNKKDIDLYKRYTVEYPGEYWEGRLREASETEYKVFNFDDFVIAEKEYYTSGDPIEISEEKYNDALNVLPPMLWRTIDGIEMFCISEFITGTYTTQYARYNDKYYCKTVDTTDKNTWINTYLIK